MPVVNRIGELREAKGWSRPELGRRMGTSGQQVERLEKGWRKLSTQWIDRLAAALDVSPQELIGDSDLPSEDELQQMLDLALREIPREATIGETTRIVASSLRAQLEQYRAVAEDPDSQD